MMLRSPNSWRLLVFVAVLAACGSPDPEQTGFVLLDEEARAAGIGIETQGERHEGALPIAVDTGEEAVVDGPQVHEPIRVAPGEVVEVRGAEGEIVRGRAETDRLVVSASESGAAMLADMLGARATRRRDGRYELRGDNLLLVASMLDGVPEVLGASAFAPRDWVLGDATGESAEGMVTARMDAPQLAPAAATGVVSIEVGPALDPASVVGVYRAATVTMIFDAAGGYRTLVRDAEIQTGTWTVAGSAVVLHPADGSAAARVGVTDTSIFDAASGAELTAAGGAS